MGTADPLRPDRLISDARNAPLGSAAEPNRGRMGLIHSAIEPGTYRAGVATDDLDIFVDELSDRDAAVEFHEVCRAALGI